MSSQLESKQLSMYKKVSTITDIVLLIASFLSDSDVIAYFKTESTTYKYISKFILRNAYTLTVSNKILSSNRHPIVRKLKIDKETGQPEHHFGHPLIKWVKSALIQNSCRNCDPSLLNTIRELEGVTFDIATNLPELGFVFDLKLESIKFIRHYHIGSGDEQFEDMCLFYLPRLSLTLVELRIDDDFIFRPNIMDQFVNLKKLELRSISLYESAKLMDGVIMTNLPLVLEELKLDGCMTTIHSGSLVEASDLLHLQYRIIGRFIESLINLRTLQINSWSLSAMELDLRNCLHLHTLKIGAINRYIAHPPSSLINLIVYGDSYSVFNGREFEQCNKMTMIDTVFENVTYFESKMKFDCMILDFVRWFPKLKSFKVKTDIWQHINYAQGLDEKWINGENIQ